MSKQSFRRSNTAVAWPMRSAPILLPPTAHTKTDEGRKFALSIQALKRVGMPDDLGSVVAFLASEDSRWVTGDIIEVEGGSKL